jgi:peptidoglycan/LPS O-acetylase OafA/YrhL
MTLKNSSGNRKIGLDAMRSLAIVFVLISHGRHFFHSIIPDKLLAVVTLGYIGVELFFVLSGFLIGSIILSTFQDEASVRVVLNFWKRRWFRTLPNYLLSVMMSGLIVVILNGFSWRIVEAVGLHLVFIQNLYQNNYPLFYPVSWSLAVEEWFYLIAPIVILFFSRLYSTSKSTLFLISILSIILLPTLARWFFAEGAELWDRDIRKLVVYRIDSIGFGLLAAWLLRYKKCFFMSVSCFKFFLGVLLLVFCHFWVVFYSSDVSLEDNFFGRVLIFSLTSVGALLILPSATKFEGFGSKRFDRYVTNVAVWSYSIYLYHMFFVKFAQWAFAREDGTFSILGALGGLLVAMTLSLGFCWLVYEVYEIRMTKYLRERFSTREGKLIL